MKKLLHTLIFSLLAVPQLVAYDNTCCNDCCSTPCFAIQGEWLYFKAVTDQTAYIKSQNDPGTIANTRTAKVSNDPNFRSGFRIAADIASCNCDRFQVRYAKVFNKHTITTYGIISDTLSGPAGGISNLGQPGNASSRISTNYNGGDLVWQQSCFNCCNFNFLAGLHVATLRYKELVERTVEVTGTNWDWSSKFWGIGPEIGFNFNYMRPCWCHLSIVGDARGAILAGRLKSNLDFVSSNLITHYTVRDTPGNWGATMAFDGRLGVRYSGTCCSFCTDIELGYEMLWYSRAIHKSVFAGPSGIGNVFTQDVYSPLSMHGPYVAFHVGF